MGPWLLTWAHPEKNTNHPSLAEHHTIHTTPPHPTPPHHIILAVVACQTKPRHAAMQENEADTRPMPFLLTTTTQSFLQSQQDATLKSSTHPHLKGEAFPSNTPHTLTNDQDEFFHAPINHSMADSPLPHHDQDQHNIHDSLLKRFRDLEVSHSRLREQFNLLLREKEEEEERRVGNSKRKGVCFRDFFFRESPYYKVLQCMGHALHISRPPPSWEIIYWYVFFPFIQLHLLMCPLNDWCCFIKVAFAQKYMIDCL